MKTICSILIFIFFLTNCAGFNKRNTLLLVAVEENLVPDKQPQKILLAPVYIPIGIVGGILDIFIIHPAIQTGSAFVDTKDFLWNIQFNGYMTEMGSLPIRVVASPVVFTIDWLIRSAFDVTPSVERKPPQEISEDQMNNFITKRDKNAIIEYLNNSYSKAKFPKEKEALKRLLTEFSYDKDNDVHITTVNYACDKNFSEYEDLLISIQTPNFSPSQLACFNRRSSKKASKAILEQLKKTDLSNDAFANYIQTLFYIGDKDDIQFLKMKLKEK